MFTYPAPVDTTYDYVPRPASWVDVGASVLVALDVTGTVTAVTVGDPYAFDLDVTGPGGVEVDLVNLPADTSTQPPYWWLRQRMVAAESKLLEGTAFTAADGSEWIAAGGRVNAYRGGTQWNRGDERYRGELTADAADLYPYADDALDWIPTEAASVSVGQLVKAFRVASGVVDEVLVTDTATHTRREWRVAGVTIGWEDIVKDSAVGELGHVWTVWERTPIPADWTRWVSSDGAQWIHVGAGAYYCWSAGGTYKRAAVSRRSEIAGGLVAAQ